MTSTSSPQLSPRTGRKYLMTRLCAFILVLSAFLYIWMDRSMPFYARKPVDAAKSLHNRTHSHHQQEHCVVHVHGLHHTGTGFLRQTIYDSIGENYASIHQHTRKPEDEGMHLQDVYPVFYKRMKKNVCEDSEHKNAIGSPYYCPSMLEMNQEDASKRLFEQWAKHWNMSKTFLIQKSPTMDILFLENVKMHKTIHVIVMRHPFAWRTTVRTSSQTMSQALFHPAAWLDVWAHVLEQLSKQRVESYAVVNYETLVKHRVEVSKELSTLIQSECGIHVPTIPEMEERSRKLKLHNGTSSEYLTPSKAMVYRWNQCERRDKMCHELMDELAPVIAQLGYSWTIDAYFNSTDSRLLFSSNKPPPRKLVEKMKELAAKYCTIN